MLILGIESSCDETSAGLVEDGKKVLSNVVYSQAKIHSRFSGVVPEIASRNHLVKILDVVEESIKGRNLKDIDAVAVTNGPGLIGALLIGLSTAKALSYSLDRPLIPVNHIEAHMYAPHLVYDIAFPYIGLVISGGHTILYKVNAFDDMKMLGSTIDDAIGEAYDKTAKLLNLGYPGGPIIDKIAKDAEANSMNFPENVLPKRGDEFNFSYSGLKTSVNYKIRELKNNSAKLSDSIIKDICISFQTAAVAQLYKKAKKAIEKTKINRLVVSGGVSANSLVRKKFTDMSNEGIETYITPIEYSGDNAAMVAGRGYVNYTLNKTGNLRTEAYSRISAINKGKR